ncbi:phage tail tube protein [Pseudaquabacterium pictum]|uniref:Phage tail protein n=1 Tax=Pseudaquabacterium pictum TaxID=2315236 RepID=A0A480ARY8_9BURK|nr:phage tail tube protein [Rubrivivax pictus]GCL64314.1 hypothetical protein AQPW35_33950 [Rubrivivax pictus]
MGKVHSQAYIKTDGKLLQTLDGAKLDKGGVERSPVMGSTGLHGYSEVKKPGMLTCEISLAQGTSLAEIEKITDATVTYEADTGQTYVIRHAFVTKTLTVQAGEGGKVAVEFCGDPAEEMLS